MWIKRLTYIEEFSYLNNSCIRNSIISMILSSSREKFTFLEQTQKQMFLLVSGRHVGGAHQDRNQQRRLHTNLHKFG